MRYGLTTVALVGPEVVQIKQNEAVGLLRHMGDEVSIGHLIVPRSQIADGGFNGQRYG